ncbi:hypothetical protein D3C76_515580 [compost metagenome]
MKKSTLTASLVLLSTMILGACSTNGVANKEELTVTTTPAFPVNEVAVTPEPSNPPEENILHPSDRPLTQTFDELEGGVSAKTGTLTQGDGYSLYIFDGFSLNAETGRLSLVKDPNYYADIEPLSSAYDLVALEQQGQVELSAIGEPKNYSGELIEHPLGYAELYLQTSSEKGLVDYMVWKNQDGEAYLFHTHNPKGELSEKFSPWLMVSLSTIEAK